MISLARGEEIIDAIKVQSRWGSGILFLLYTRVALEVHGKGLCLELQYDEIRNSCVPKKDSLILFWTEGDITYDIKFNIKNAVDISYKINAYKK